MDSAKILDTKSFSASSGVLKIICMDLVDTNDEKWLENTRKKCKNYSIKKESSFAKYSSSSWFWGIYRSNLKNAFYKFSE